MRAALVGILSLFASGCAVALPTPPSAGCTLQSDRSIVVCSDGSFRSLWCDAVSGDAALVRIGLFDSREVRVHPTEIKVDGVTVATIPDATKSIFIAEEEEYGRLRIATDGEDVYDAGF